MFLRDFLRFVYSGDPIEVYCSNSNHGNKFAIGSSAELLSDPIFYDMEITNVCVYNNHLKVYGYRLEPEALPL